MISNEEVQCHLAAQAGVKLVEVTGDGHHYNILIVADYFDGKSPVARQQFVYKYLNQWILSDQMHAVNMQTWTSSEWEKLHG